MNYNVALSEGVFITIGTCKVFKSLNPTLLQPCQENNERDSSIKTQTQEAKRKSHSLLDEQLIRYFELLKIVDKRSKKVQIAMELVDEAAKSILGEQVDYDGPCGQDVSDYWKNKKKLPTAGYSR